MIEFAPITSRPYADAGCVAVLLHNQPIGTLTPAADGRSAHVVIGMGLDGEGAGFVYDRDRYGRPQCIYRAAAELILAEGGFPDRIVT